MGRIADSLAGTAGARGAKAARSFAPPESGRLWRETFGVSKEDPRPRHRPGQHGLATSLAASDLSYKRLLEAMRSRAPGNWTDNRWEQSGHFKGVTYTALHRCAMQLSRAEFQVYHKDPTHPDGKRPVIQDEPAHRLVDLLSKPNKDDSFGDLLYSWFLQMHLTGTALTWMVPNLEGRPAELYPIPTALAVPGATIDTSFPDGYYRIQPVYPYGPFSQVPSPYSSAGATIDARWMLRFKFTHPLLRYEGYAPQTALQLHLDEVESMDRSRWYSMRRSINPSAVLQMDEMDGAEPIPDEELERIRAEFEAAFQGPENHGNLFVPAPGSRLEPWGTSPKEMDYQAGWEQLVGFVMAGLGITKQAAGMIDATSYSTLFATMKQLYWTTLEPICDMIAAKLTRHLAVFYGDDLIVEIRCKRIDDHDVKLAKLRELMAAKALTKNEMRVELEMPPTTMPWGMEIAGTEPLMIGPDGMLMPGLPIMPSGNPTLFPGLTTGPTMGMLPPGVSPPDGPDGEQSGDLNEDDDGKGQPEDVTKTRPKPGKLGRGALGRRKSLYDAVREACRNGH